jgi:hypothetical protein
LRSSSTLRRSRSTSPLEAPSEDVAGSEDEEDEDEDEDEDEEDEDETETCMLSFRGRTSRSAKLRLPSHRYGHVSCGARTPRSISASVTPWRDALSMRETHSACSTCPQGSAVSACVMSSRQTGHETGSSAGWAILGGRELAQSYCSLARLPWVNAV